jgi:hypothetical protein
MSNAAPFKLPDPVKVPFPEMLATTFPEVSCHSWVFTEALFDLTVILDVLAEVPMATFPLYCPILISPVSKISRDGIPETSLTENIVPVSPSEIENNCPAVPSKDTVPVSRVRSVMGVLFAPVNLIVGLRVADPVLGVINIFLSELAI